MNYRSFVLFFALLTCLVLSVFINVFHGTDIVYTHLFYIPIILTAIWYPRYAIILAAGLGLIHIGCDYAISETIRLGVFIRAIIFIFVAYLTSAEARDVAVWKKAQNKLKESEAQYVYLFEQNPVPMLIYELGSLKILAVNDAFVAHYGYNKIEILTLLLTDLYPESEKKAIAELTQQLRGHAYVGECHHLKKDGSQITIEIHSHGISYENHSARIAVVNDVTERKRVKDALQKSEELYRTVFENTGTASVLIEENTIISLANAEFERLSQYSKLDIENKKSWTEFVVQEDLDRMRAQHQLRRVKKEASLKQYEFRFIPRDGNIHNILLTIDVIPGTKRSIASLLDITKRIEAEEALRKSEEKYRNIVDTANEGIWTFDKELITTFANERMAEILGYTNKELLIGKPLINFIFEEDLNDHFERMEKRRKGISEIFERRFRCKDGQEVWTLVSGTARFDDNNNFNGTLGLVTDITELKNTEQALRKSEQRYKQLLESITDYTYSVEIKDGHPGKTIHSYGCKKVTGYTPEDYSANQKLWLQMVHPDDQKIVEHYADPLCEGKEIPVLEHRIIHKNGSVIWVRNTYVLKHDASGKVIGYDGLISDITERKLIEIEIQMLNTELENRVIKRTAQLEAANKELEAFSYSVSHDLRAPLRHASGFVDLLMKRFKSDIPEKGQHYLSTIADSVHQMGILIDDLLQFSRTGRAEMKKTDSDMNEIVQEVFTSLSQDNPNRIINWTINELPLIFCDRAMLKLVWMNLMSNAVKFTRTREISKIEIGVLEDENEYTFFVRDNGVGFDMQYSQKLFGVFQRFHSMEEFEGTGIGLANVRRIILRHEGRTWAEAEPDKGATFYFTLPKHNKEKS